jgi:hypothetical protein
VGGLFSCHPTDAQQQQELLAGIDKKLTPEQQQQCLGPNGDGTITLDEAKAALDSLPREKVLFFWERFQAVMASRMSSIALSGRRWGHHW